MKNRKPEVQQRNKTPWSIRNDENANKSPQNSPQKTWYRVTRTTKKWG